MRAPGGLRDSAVIAGAQVLNRGSLVVAGLVVSRFVGTDAFATYSYVQLTASFVATFSGMGIGLLAMRAAAGAAASGEELYARRLSGVLLLAAVGSGGAAIAAVALPSEWLGISEPSLRAYLAALSSTTVLASVSQGSLVGSRLFLYVARSAVIAAFFTLGGAIVGALVGSRSPALAGLLIGQSCALLLNVRILFGRGTFSRIPAMSTIAMAAVRDLVIVAVPIFVTSLIASGAVWWSGRRLLRDDASAAEFATFAIGLQLFAIVLFIPGSINQALLPRLFGAALQAGTQKLLIVRGVTATVVAALPVAAAGMLLEAFGVISRLYGRDDNIFGVVTSCMAAAVFAAACSVFGNAEVAEDGQLRWMAAMSVWALLMLLVPLMFPGPITALATAKGLAISYCGLFACALALRRSGGRASDA